MTETPPETAPPDYLRQIMERVAQRIETAPAPPPARSAFAEQYPEQWQRGDEVAASEVRFSLQVFDASTETRPAVEVRYGEVAGRAADPAMQDGKNLRLNLTQGTHHIYCELTGEYQSGSSEWRITGRKVVRFSSESQARASQTKAYLKIAVVRVESTNGTLSVSVAPQPVSGSQGFARVYFTASAFADYPWAL